MDKLRFYSFQIRDKLDLDLYANYFGCSRPIKWQEFLFLDNRLIQEVLKRDIKDHEIYLYEYGVATFVGFYEDEIRELLFLFHRIQEVNYSYFAQYYEHFQLKVGAYKEAYLEEEKPLVLKDLKPIIAEITAKSVGLHHMEADLEKKINGVEPLLIQMSKGRVKIDKKTKEILGEIIVFKYNLIRTLRLLELTSDENRKMIPKEAIVFLMEQFELQDRYQIVINKIDELKQMLYRYYEFHYHKKERDLYKFEVLLLAMFPLSYFVKSDHIKQVLSWIIDNIMQMVH